MSTDNAEQSADKPTEQVETTINGEPVETTVEPRLKLGDFLRRRGYRGVRIGCEHGVCGACNVLVDGAVMKSCLMYAVQIDGRDVMTVEGLTAEGGELHPIQEAFHEEHGLQCGFCTSGFVMATAELLDHTPDPSREDIEAGLADNICRCTGYQNIYDAVERAADAIDDTDPVPDTTGGSPDRAADSSDGEDD